jgi:tRNA(His) 5'-end guanylyltransferase
MGDRHKAYEARETMQKLMPGLPVVVRLDGRAFHTFTRKLARPYDARLSRAMIETTKHLVAETNASIGYTQSDEISIVFPNTDPSAQMLFGGRIQKLCSLLAAMASVKFNKIIAQTLPEKAHLDAIFDARVYQYPTLDLAAEAFVWREMDATRNSLTMAAHAYYSHKELHKAGFSQKHDMLHAKGINWADYPTFFKKGSHVRRETVFKMLSEEELARIPAKHRPTGPVQRSEMKELDLPPVLRITNLNDVLFFGEAPLEKSEAVTKIEALVD